jgi:hypothetical protein
MSIEFWLLKKIKIKNAPETKSPKTKNKNNFFSEKCFFLLKAFLWDIVHCQNPCPKWGRMKRQQTVRAHAHKLTGRPRL